MSFASEYFEPKPNGNDDGSPYHGHSITPKPEFGYHRIKINKGVLGEASKITEEYVEFLDAFAQKNSVMELVELSDLLGAIEAYTKKKYLIDLDTLLTMTRATQRAFELGQRK